MNPYGPYSPIFQAGGSYYISGQVGVDPLTKKALENIEGQTNQAMKNIGKLLAEQKLDFSNLVKTTIYITDIKHFALVNKIYESYFDAGRPKPARACVEVSSLPNVSDEKLLIEIEAVAYKD